MNIHRFTHPSYVHRSGLLLTPLLAAGFVWGLCAHMDTRVLELGNFGLTALGMPALALSALLWAQVHGVAVAAYPELGIYANIGTEHGQFTPHGWLLLEAALAALSTALLLAFVHFFALPPLLSLLPLALFTLAALSLVRNPALPRHLTAASA